MTASDTTQRPPCWCGSKASEEYSPGYDRCAACGTLRSKTWPRGDPANIRDDESDFYGKKYWLEHQSSDLGNPTLADRAQRDLPERCTYWLRTLLRYKIPPAKVLEVGCAHGASVALMQAAGFEATGLELSPWIVNYARRTFDIPMLQGPLEEQDLEPHSLDAITLFDVLEHLVNPSRFIQVCSRLLRPDGVLLIQTPCVPGYRSFSELESEADPFLIMLKEKEHLNLFSKDGIRAFLTEHGFGNINDVPALFDHYDMFLATSQTPIETTDEGDIGQSLAHPSGRIVEGLLTLEEQRRSTEKLYLEAKRNLNERGAQLEQVTKRLQVAESDATQRLANNEELQRLLDEANSDRDARLESNRELQRLLDEANSDRDARLESNRELQRLLDEANSDRDARLESNRELQRLLNAAKAESAARQASAQCLERDLAERETDLASILNAPTYRILKRLGLQPAVDTSSKSVRRGDVHPSRTTTQHRRIAVDLTPLLPGGENGGAKIMVLELLRSMMHLAPELEWVLLTSDITHEELAGFDSDNVSRQCVLQREAMGSSDHPSLGASVRGAAHRMATKLPPGLLKRLVAFYWTLPSLPSSGSRVAVGAQPDLLFCPFTAPFYSRASAPTVSIIYDLQYLYYPAFFTSEERHGRAMTFQNACRRAQHIICISDFVRDTVLENSDLTPERVSTVHIHLATRLQPPDAATQSATLKSLQVVEGGFLLYPANFWQHKNHRMLFAAFGMFRSRHPDSSLKLVCTGSPGREMDALAESVATMGLASSIVFPGFLNDEEYSALLSTCLALIFPSLFEGFGMPLMEAMARGKAVLCSNVTALPEVVGDAALLFNPKRPKEILEAIERIEKEPGLRRDLARRGLERYSRFSDTNEMAKAYLNVFQDTLDSPTPSTLQGIHPDGWTTPQIVLSAGQDQALRTFEIELDLPPSSPHAQITATISGAVGNAEHLTLSKEKTLYIRRQLPHEECEIGISFSPTFRPRDLAINEDSRELGCVCRKARLITANETIDFLKT